MGEAEMSFWCAESQLIILMMDVENPLISLTRNELFINGTPKINFLAYATFVVLITFYSKW